MTKQIKLSGAVKLRAAQADGPRKLAILGYSGGIMSVSVHGPIVIDLQGMSFDQTVPVLADHENSIGAIIGSGRPQTNGRILEVEAVCADSEMARTIVALLASGVSLQSSVGCDIVASEWLRAGEKIKINDRELVSPKGGVTVIRQSILREITVCPIGADSTTSVRISAAKLKGSTMSFEEYVASLGLDFAAISQEVKDALQLAFDQMNSEETTDPEPPMNASAGAVVGILADHAPSLISRAIKEKWSPVRAQREALASVRAERARNFPGVGRMPESGKPSDPFEAAILVKAGFGNLAAKEYGADIAEIGHKLSRQSLVDLMASHLRSIGKQVPHDRSEMIRAALSGGDLSTSLSNISGKVLQEVWKTTRRTWDAFVTRKTVTDFKVKTSIRPTFAGSLALLPKGSEIDHGTTSEESFTYSVSTFARQYQFDRSDVMNDDLNVIAEVLPGLSRAAVLTAGDLVYATIMGGVGTHWTSGRKNLAAGAFTMPNLESAIAKLRLQTASDGSSVSIDPSCLVVPPSLEFSARSYMSATLLNRDSSSDKQPMDNPLAGLMSVEVEPRLQNGCKNPKTNASLTGSTTAYWIFGNQVESPVIFASTGDSEAPTVQQFGFDSDPNRLAISFRVWADYGAALGEYRASVYSPGT